MNAVRKNQKPRLKLDSRLRGNDEQQQDAIVRDRARERRGPYASRRAYSAAQYSASSHQNTSPHHAE